MNYTSKTLAVCLLGLLTTAGCAGRAYGPSYGPPAVGRGVTPIYAGPPPVISPVTVPVTPTPTPTPAQPQPPSGPSANQPGDLDLSLQPTQKTSWVVAPPQYQVAWGQPISPRYAVPTTTRYVQTANGLQLAGLGQSIDGRSIAYGRPPVLQTAGRTETDQAARVDGIPSTPSEDLQYHGGRTLKDLTYFNVFVGGPQKWSQSDREWIDYSVEAAMTDPHLNHVVMQYFNNQPISTQFTGSFWMGGWQPTRVTQAQIKQVTRALYQQGSFKGLPSNSTIVCFYLPPGTILEDPSDSGQLLANLAKTIPVEEEANSQDGLGGYHGSVRIGSDTAFYAVMVYSEMRSNGFRNGIPAFAEPWKSIAATAYHELQEARTDPDVDDAISTNQEQYLGWTSERGHEIADFPVEQAQPLSKIFREVQLADGSGLVPIQFMYSNAVHGAEGPIPQPHAGPTLPPAQRRTPRPGSTGTPVTPPKPPADPNAGLDWVEKEWTKLPDAVKQQILKLIEASTSDPAPR